jgi:hypothetical protein
MTLGGVFGIDPPLFSVNIYIYIYIFYAFIILYKIINATSYAIATRPPYILFLLFIYVFTLLFLRKVMENINENPKITQLAALSTFFRRKRRKKQPLLFIVNKKPFLYI